MSVTSENEVSSTASIARLAAESGITRVTMLAWRDLDDPEAGGSELHAHRIATRWAAAGLDVELRTSMVPGAAMDVDRDGYHVVRRGSRYGVFPLAIAHGLRHRRRPEEALVEIWNGMPFFSPLWYRGPKVVFLHHVHGPMWQMSLPRFRAALGSAIEHRIAPPLYRWTSILTLSTSSEEEIVEKLHLPRKRVSVVPPGIEPTFHPGGSKSTNPSVVAVGRLVPVKQFDKLIEALIAAKAAVPALTATIIGEGYLRSDLETQVAAAGADSWLRLPGRVDDAALVDAYQSSWVVASTSLREGWGMTLTEAAACGTPAVATDIAGHRDAVVNGASGLLVDEGAPFVNGLVAVLGNEDLRRALSAGALENAARFTWDATAVETFRALAAVAMARAARKQVRPSSR